MKRKIGRNDLCSCGSGLKYKKCCMNNVKVSYSIPKISDSHKEIEDMRLNMLESYKENIRQSELWPELIEMYGEIESEKLLNQIDCHIF